MMRWQNWLGFILLALMVLGIFAATALASGFWPAVAVWTGSIVIGALIIGAIALAAGDWS